MDAELASLSPYDLGQTNDPSAVPYLIRFLRDGTTNEKRLAASAVGKLIPSARHECESAIEPLLECLLDSAPQVRQYALKALGRLTLPSNALVLVNELLRRESKDYNRSLAKRILHKHGASDQPTDASDEVKQNAALSLKQRIQGCLDTLDILEQDLPEHLARAWSAEDRVADARAVLECVQNRVIANGVEGKNEAERRARVVEASAKERAALEHAERQLTAVRRDRDEVAATSEIQRQRLQGLELLVRLRTLDE